MKTGKGKSGNRIKMGNGKLGNRKIRQRKMRGFEKMATKN